MYTYLAYGRKPYFLEKKYTMKTMVPLLTAPDQEWMAFLSFIWHDMALMEGLQNTQENCWNRSWSYGATSIITSYCPRTQQFRQSQDEGGVSEIPEQFLTQMCHFPAEECQWPEALSKAPLVPQDIENLVHRTALGERGEMTISVIWMAALENTYPNISWLGY